MFQGMEYVYEVYKEKNFSKAAKNMFISQPSLSATIRRIETRIGYPIFDRSTKPLGLTECGKEYIKSVENILAIENAFANFVSDWGSLKTGSLILGGSSLFSSWVLPPLMGQFAAKYPHVQITLIEENTAKLEQLLQNGSVDLVIDNCVLDHSVFDHWIFRDEHLLLAVPKTFHINQEIENYQISVDEIRSRAFLEERLKPVPLELFRKEPFIILKYENDTRKRAMDLCQAHGFTPKVVFELDQQMTSYNITCSGMGISFISDTLVSRVPPNPDVVYYKLAGEPSVRNLYFYWKTGRYFSRAMEEFLNIAKREKKS